MNSEGGEDVRHFYGAVENKRQLDCDTFVKLRAPQNMFFFQSMSTLHYQTLRENKEHGRYAGDGEVKRGFLTSA